MKFDDLVAFIKQARETADDNTALKAKELYPTWKEGITITQEMIDKGQNRYQYGDRLYKVTQSHTTQSDWTPDIVPAMFTVIDETHSGSLTDPIPAVASMEYTLGLYYIEDGVIYKMIRCDETDGTQTLHYLPSALVGNYFEVV